MIRQSPKGIRILGRGGVRLQQFARIIGFHAGMKGCEKHMKQYAEQRKAMEKNPNSKDDMFEIEISWTGETISVLAQLTCKIVDVSIAAGNRWVN